MRLIRCGFVVIFLFVLLQCMAIIIGMAAEDTGQLFTMEEIVVIASKFPEKLLDSIASVELISAEEIKELQAESLADILNSISGMTVSDYGSTGGIKAISIRGSSPEQVLVMIDGRVVNDAQTGKIDLGIIPASMIEKIEIYRGPASAIYGANALGGVINVITKEGQDEIVGNINVSIGTYGLKDYEVAYQGSSDDVSYYFSGNYLTDDGVRENSQLSKTGVFGKVISKIDEQTELGLSLLYQNYNRGVPGSVDFPSPQANQKDNNFDVDINWQRKKEDKDYNVKVFYFFHKVIYNDPGMWGYVGPSTHATNSFGAAFDCTDYNFSVGDEEGSHEHILTYGAEVKDNLVNSSDIGEHNGLNGALFVQDVWQPSDMDDLKVTAGVRYDYNQIFGSQLNPHVGFSYRLQDELNFHISVGKAYRAPNFDDLYWPEGAFVAGNPDLVPETAWAYEAGLRYISKEGDFKGELNVFRKNAKNLINWAVDNDGIWKPLNIGQARIDGIEILLEKELGDHVKANLGYSYLNALDLDTDSQLKPYHKYDFGIGYYDNTGDNEEEIYARLDGYAITGRPNDLTSYCFIDLNIGKELTLGKEDNQKAKLEIAVKNILDQQPEIVTGYPVTGRTYTTGISFEF